MTTQWTRLTTTQAAPIGVPLSVDTTGGSVILELPGIADGVTDGAEVSLTDTSIGNALDRLAAKAGPVP